MSDFSSEDVKGPKGYSRDDLMMDLEKYVKIIEKHPEIPFIFSFDSGNNSPVLTHGNPVITQLLAKGVEESCNEDIQKLDPAEQAMAAMAGLMDTMKLHDKHRGEDPENDEAEDELKSQMPDAFKKMLKDLENDDK